jgi:hypothetical protein
MGSRSSIQLTGGASRSWFPWMFPRPVIACFLFLVALAPVPSQAQDAPIRGFLSVEPFELRLESLVRVEPFRESWRMEGDSIGFSARQAVLDNLATLFESGVNLKSPGKTIAFTERSFRFVVPDPEKGFVEDERQNIPISEALVGMTLSSTVEGIDGLEIEWLWFAPGQTELVLEIASRGKPSARKLTPDSSKTSWKLDDSVALPTLQTIPGITSVERRPLKYLIFLGLAMLLYAGFVVIRDKTKAPSWTGLLLVGGIVVGGLALKVRTREIIVPETVVVEDVVYALLRNTYHAFDFRDESAIYDTLEASVTGPLLEEVYLEMRKSLELESKGGPRVRVYEIALRDCKEIGTGGLETGSFRTKADWVTIGEVTHWGHTHERTNKYEAEMTVSAIDDTWKISGLTLLNEERIQKISRRPAETQP